LYHHSLSVAYAVPGDYDSDIVINWRYKHINPAYKDLNRYIVRFTKDGRTFISGDGGYGRSGRRVMEEYANLVSIRWDYYSKSLIIRQPDKNAVDVLEPRKKSLPAVKGTGLDQHIYEHRITNPLSVRITN
jgi:hypothetical protein